MKRFSSYISGLLATLTLFAGFLFSASPALADGTYCWCRVTTSGVCSNYRADQVVSGGAAGGNITTDQCNTYCAARGTTAAPVRSIHLDTTYNASSYCTSDCAPGEGSCVGVGTASSTPVTPVGTGSASSAPITLYNPLGANTDIPAFIGRGIRGVLGLIGAVALLMFIYGGVIWMTAGGDSKRVEGAKSIIKNSVIGLLLIFFSYSLIGIFFSFFTAR